MKDDFWVEENSNGSLSLPLKRKRVGKRTLEFIDWGSRPLIEFLGAIGKDTGKKYSQHEVSQFITKYINDKGLIRPEKKKKVMCDMRLKTLFEKNSVPRRKIYELLEEHFTESHDSSSDKDSEEEDYKEKKSSKSNSKKVPEIPKSCFAAVIPENIKLVYLKRTLIQELWMVPEEFEGKILGSFVRMKTDPDDIYQKNRFQLQQVTGVEKVTGPDDGGIEIRLRVANFFKEVPISMLSDDKFYEEELEDLRDRIKAGKLKRPMVTEIELKARMLHTDITKHSIRKELSLLEKLIDHANDKGRRRELFEYFDRRKELQTPSEVEKMLNAVPEVIAEELEPETTPVDRSSDKAEENDSSTKSLFRGNSDVSSTGAPGNGDVAPSSQAIANDSHSLKERDGGLVNGVVHVKDQNGSGDVLTPLQSFFNHGYNLRGREEGIVNGVMPVNFPTENQPDNLIVKEPGIFNAANNGNTSDPVQVTILVENACPEKQEKQVAPTQVIELSDDDSEPEPEPKSLDDAVWHYKDPRGNTQGPFSLNLLKKWSDANYFPRGFTVWRSGQTPDQTVLLLDVFREIFRS